MAETKDTKPGANDKTVATGISLQRIPSRCVKKFYSAEGATVEVGQSYEFVRTEDNFYPWPILRPEDPALEKELKAEYFAAREDIDAKAKEQNAAALTDVFLRLSNRD